MRFYQTVNVAKVEKWFGIKRRDEPWQHTSELSCVLPGKVVLIIGPSGAGKSRLLTQMRREFEQNLRGRWVDLGSVRLPRRAVVDCFGKEKLERVLEVLNRVGLGEAWTY